MPSWRCRIFRAFPRYHWPQGQSLRSHLILLVLAALLPLVLFAVSLLLLFVHEQRRTTERGMRDTARALALAMDREAAEVHAALSVLTLSRPLAAGDLAGFYRQCLEALRFLPPESWLTLSDAEGQLLLNTREPYGAPLPRQAAPDVVRRIVETAQPGNSDLVIDALTQQPVVTLDVPVLRDGQVSAVLSLVRQAATLGRLFVEQRLPPGWLWGLNDSQQRVIATNPELVRFIGEPVTPRMAKRSATADEGWFPNLAQDGTPVYSAFSRVRSTGWAVALLAPAAVVEAPGRRSLWLIISGGLVLSAVAVGWAVGLGRRLAAPIKGLVTATQALAQGRPVPMAPVGAVQEVQEVEAALLDAAVRLQQAEAERTQREAAQRFLAEASTLLASSLDVTTQIERLAQLLVPTLADWCSIDLLQDDGYIHRLAVVHADPAKAALAEQLRQQYPVLAAEAPHTLARVLRTGQSWFDPAVSAERLRGEARDAAHWELEQALGFRAEIVVPLLTRGWVLGTLTCVLGEGARRYRAADLALAEDLARRAALALDNARLYQEARAAQAALQQAHDVLEQRVAERTAALEQAMAERQRLEQEAQRAAHFSLLGRLAAGVSHELRNPLGAVFLNVDLLAEELAQPSPDSTEAVAESLAEIKSNLARVEDLIEDYLALVRVGALERTVQDLGAALQGWAAEFRALAAGRGMTLQAEGLADLGAVAFHANTLRRALLNLVQNGLEAMAPGGTLSLRGRVAADRVEIEVTDTGSGIPAARQQQIFEPLHTTKPGGTGLGLYIVQEVVAAHGGHITVESAVGQGTTFTLTLPRAASVATGPPAGQAQPPQV